MTKNLVQELKPYVTTFSAAIPLQHQHGDIVRVGGVVKNILNLNKLFETSFEEDLRNEGVYVTVDDGIGEITLVLAPKAHEIYEDNFSELKEGDTIIAEGGVCRLDTTHTYEGPRGKRITVDNHKEETVRVLIYHLTPLPETAPEAPATQTE